MVPPRMTMSCIWLSPLGILEQSMSRDDIARNRLALHGPMSQRQR